MGNLLIYSALFNPCCPNPGTLCVDYSFGNSEISESWWL